VLGTAVETTTRVNVSTAMARMRSRHLVGVASAVAVSVEAAIRIHDTVRKGSEKR
jgi:hypothetical protein